MHKVSSEFKKGMNAYLRNKGYISVGIGVINQEAQGSAKADGDFAYWSNANVFGNGIEAKNTYATLEEDFMVADGSMIFLPENNDLAQFEDTGITMAEFGGAIKFEFKDKYSIKGLTFTFPKNCYPTSLEVISEEKTLTYENDSTDFSTTDVIGDTSYIIVRPLSMIGGNKRFRVISALMGVGLSFGNDEIADSTFEEYINAISQEVSSIVMSIKVLDYSNKFNVDNDNSFVNFLEQGQAVTISEGLELDDGSIEWVQLGNLNVSEWSSKKGEFTLTATDKFAQMEDEYDGFELHTRTAYEEAVSILSDMGFQPDEYVIDDYLKDVILENPMPVGTHKECLQLLANACRCAVFQTSQGKIVIRGNFANVLDPDDLSVETTDAARWSKPENLVIGSDAVYADMTKDFMMASGTMFFMPEDDSYLETSYVSSQISNDEGLFEENPIVGIILPAGYQYYGINVDFDGNAPKEVVIHTYYKGQHVESILFDDLSKENILFYEFELFDSMFFEFTKAYPNNHVLVNKISFGDSTDYVLTRNNMIEEPYGFKEEVTKAIKVKIYTYENDSKGNPKEVEDEVYYTHTINTVGCTRLIENPLIHTEQQAQELAEWLGNYFKNNVSYEVAYRGDPRLNAMDIIHMESEVVNNLQVAIEKHTLSFNGAWSGALTMRKSIKLS